MLIDPDGRESMSFATYHGQGSMSGFPPTKNYEAWNAEVNAKREARRKAENKTPDKYKSRADKIIKKAMKAIKKANKLTKKTKYEHAFIVTEKIKNGKGTGKFRVHKIKTDGKKDRVTQDYSTVKENERVVASFHTHPPKATREYGYRPAGGHSSRDLFESYTGLEGLALEAVTSEQDFHRISLVSDGENVYALMVTDAEKATSHAYGDERQIVNEKAYWQAVEDHWKSQGHQRDHVGSKNAAIRAAIGGSENGFAFYVYPIQN